MNIQGTITPEQVDELDAIRNELFYLYLDIIDYRSELQNIDIGKRVADAYNHAALLYAAVDHRAVALIDRPGVNSDGVPCQECQAPEGTYHFDGCTQR